MTNNLPTIRLSIATIIYECFNNVSAPPALLISYFYLNNFITYRKVDHYRDWCLDSGAFSAYQMGLEIDLQEYIDCCKKLLKEDKKLVEVYALDVIGNPTASIENTREMWRQGVQAIPTFHYGSKWSILKKLIDTYPKVAIGGCVGKHDKDKFASQCFARVWPNRLHGFGFGSEKSIMLNPWESVDSSNWRSLCRYGRWESFGDYIPRFVKLEDEKLLRVEVEHYLKMEEKARHRWKKEMKNLYTPQRLLEEQKKIKALLNK